MAVIVLLLGAGVFVAWIRTRVTRDVSHQLTALREAGLPTSAEELEAWFPDVPPDENAAKVYEQAFDAGKPVQRAEGAEKDLWQALWNMPPCERFPASIEQQVAAYLDANAARLRLLHEAKTLPRSRHPLNLSKSHGAGINERTRPSYFDELPSMTRLLGLQARYAAQTGNTDLAVEAIIAGLAVAESLREEPLLVSQYERIGYHAIAATYLQDVLCLASLTDQQLVCLAQAFGRADARDALSKALTGEQALGLSAFTDFEYIDRNIQADPVLQWIPGKTRTAIFVAETIGWINSDRNRYLQGMGELERLSHLPYREALPRARDLRKQAQDLPYRWRFAPGRIWWASESFEHFAKDAAILQNVCTALAIERYRLIRRDLPESLHDLVPTFLDAMPEDPFDGAPLRYRVTDEGYIVYSVAHDLLDGGGADFYKDSSYTNESPYTGDLTFRMRR